MDEDRMGVSPFTSGRQFSEKPAATEKPSRLRLARRNFLIVVGIVLAGGLLKPAYADECDRLKKELIEANAKKKAAAAHAASLAAAYQAIPNGRVTLGGVKAATAKTRKYEQGILARI